MEKTSFTTFEIIKRLDIHRECLREWMKRGYIRPSIQKSSGPGTKNLFCRLDLYQIEFFQSLLSRGLSRVEAARCADMISYNDIKKVESYMSKKTSQYYNKKHPYPTFAIIKRYTEANGQIELSKGFIYSDGTLPLEQNDNFDDVIVKNLTKLREKVDKRFNLEMQDDTRELLK